MASICIIPARGGSKRLPRKNIQLFHGFPIISYPIQVALKVFDKVVVSTEDEEIKSVALRYGAEVYDRPKELADDVTTAGEAVADCLEHYPGYDLVACMYSTSVLVTEEMLKKSLTMLGDANSIYSVIEYPHPIQRALQIKGKYIELVNPEFKSVRTQDCDPYYHDAGQFYIMRTRPFLSARSLYFSKSVPFIVKSSEVQDIDNPDDWKMAELKYEIR